MRRRFHRFSQIYETLIREYSSKIFFNIRLIRGLKGIIFSIIILIVTFSSLSLAQSDNWVKIDSSSCFDIKVLSDTSIYACTLERGLEYSNDGGTNWVQKNPSFGRYAVGSIAVNESTGSIFISSLLDNKIYKSTDRGDSWSVSLNEKGKIYNIIAKYGNVYAVDSMGTFYRSTDDGTMWDSSIVSNLPLTSIGICSTGQLFISAYGGKIYTTDDAGNKWNGLKLSINTDTVFYYVLVNEQDKIFALSKYLISTSTDYGETWNYTPLHTFLDGIRIIALDTANNLYSGINSLYKSGDRVSWLNLSGKFINIRKIEVYKNYVYTATQNGIFRHDKSIPVYTGSNYFPLHKGNKWLFSTGAYNYTDYTEKLQLISIDKDTVINKTKYYKYKNYWVRYSEKEKKVYDWYNNSENLYMDFILNSGSLLGKYPTSLPGAVILEGSRNLFGNKVNYKGYSEGSTWVEGESKEQFGENMGPISLSYARYAGPDETESSDLIGAYIYDSTNTPKYYSDHYKTEISLKPLNTISSTSFQLIFSVNHKLGSLLIGPIYMESYYSKGDTIINNDTVYAGLLPGTNSEVVTFPVDTSLLKTGYIFNYRITTKDNSLIAEYSYSPDSGYYQCIWDKNTSVEDNKEKVLSFRLEQNYPNPFNPETTFRYSIPVREHVTLKIYDILGRLVKILVDEEKAAGRYKVHFNGSGLSSGAYLYQINAGNFRKMMKFLIMK